MPPSKHLVERGELALLFDRMPGRAAPFKDREDKCPKLSLELRLLENASKLVCNRIARQLVHAAAERAENDAVVSVFESEPIDGTDLVELDGFALRRKSAVRRHVLPLLVAVAVRLAEAERGDRNHAAREGNFAEGVSIAQVSAEKLILFSHISNGP